MTITLLSPNCQSQVFVEETLNCTYFYLFKSNPVKFFEQYSCE